MKHQVYYRFLFFLLLLITSLSLSAKQILRVLAIGNSFSVDAVEQNLYELASAQGDSLIIGNAYIGGCSIDHHWNNAQTKKAEYSYRKIVGGIKTTYPHKNLQQIILDEPWDVITLQQASPVSGVDSSYVHLPDLIKYVKANTTTHNPRIVFHQTWAYAKKCSRIGYKENYDNSQLKMYRAILSTLHKVLPSTELTEQIPCGIAIQRARAFFGDVLNRDGFHLSYGIGRYTAACTWCEFLTGKSILGNSFCSHLISPQEGAAAQLAAHQAITMSKDTLTAPKYVINGEFYTSLPADMNNEKINMIGPANGLHIFQISLSTPLPDSDRFYALQDYQVMNLEALKKLIAKPKRVTKITRSK